MFPQATYLYDDLTSFAPTSSGVGTCQNTNCSIPACSTTTATSTSSWNLGISEEDIHEFFLNGHYSPRHTTIITRELDQLTGVDGREAFLAVAEEATSEELVLFYQHVVEMMRGYHVHIGAVDRLLVLPRIPALYTKNKTLVVMLLSIICFGPRAWR